MPAAATLEPTPASPPATGEDAGAEAFDVTACLSAVRAGDQDAARALVAHLRPLVARIVRAHLPRRVAEEDLHQDIFLKMFTRIDQYRGPQPFTHWVSRLAVTTCLDALRAQGRRPELRWADLSEDQVAVLDRVQSDTPAEGAAGVAGTGGDTARELVQELLATLPTADRTVLTLLDLQQHSVAEVCALTGWGASMVKVRAFRARRKLRKQLEQLERAGRPRTSTLSSLSV